MYLGNPKTSKKIEKRRSKLEEERRMAKLKRRIISSDEEIIEEDVVEIMTPSKNGNENIANGDKKQTEKPGHLVTIKVAGAVMTEKRAKIR